MHMHFVSIHMCIMQRLGSKLKLSSGCSKFFQYNVACVKVVSMGIIKSCMTVGHFIGCKYSALCTPRGL